MVEREKKEKGNKCMMSKSEGRKNLENNNPDTFHFFIIFSLALLLILP
jgi:hypothetical protein